MILGAFFNVLPSVGMSASWTALNVTVQNTIKFLIQLMPSMGIAIIVFKSLMLATVRGRD